MDDNEKNKKKPVIFKNSDKFFYRENDYAQQILLKALAEGASIEEMKKRAGIRSAAEVYRTLDKIALRREYHDSLARNGMTFDSIVDKLKILMDSGSEKIQLGAVQTLMKSLGLDKYEKVEDSGKTWEEELVKAAEQAQKEGKDLKLVEAEEFTDYEVITPETPQSERERQEHERKIGKEIYGE